MNDHTDPEDSIEDRVETIEGEIDDIHFEKIEARIDVIEIEQELLRDDLDSVVESYRTDKGEIPHIDSVQALHNRLERIEENVATLRESLGDVVESGE
jgi:septation ring formation regulator EzrA